MKKELVNSYLSPRGADSVYSTYVDALPGMFQPRVQDPGGFSDPIPRIYHAHAKAFRKKRGKPRPNTHSRRRDWRTDGRITNRLNFRLQQIVGIVVHLRFSERAKRYKVHGPREKGREWTWRRRRRFDTRRPREMATLREAARSMAGLERKDELKRSCDPYPFETERGVVHPHPPLVPSHEGYSWAHQERWSSRAVRSPFGFRLRLLKRYSGAAWRFRSKFWRFRPYGYYRGRQRNAFLNTSLRWDGADRTLKHTTQPVRVKCYADGPGPNSYQRRVRGRPKWKKGIFARRCWRGKRNYRMGAPSWSMRWGVQHVHGVMGRSHALRKHRDHAYTGLQRGKVLNGSRPGYSVPATRVAAWHTQTPDSAPVPNRLSLVAKHQTDDDFWYRYRGSKHSAFPADPALNWQAWRSPTTFGPRPIMHSVGSYELRYPWNTVVWFDYRKGWKPVNAGYKGAKYMAHGSSQARVHWGAWDKMQPPGRWVEMQIGPGIVHPVWTFDDWDRTRRFPLAQPWVNEWPRSGDRKDHFPAASGTDRPRIYSDSFGSSYQLCGRAGDGDNLRWLQEGRTLTEFKSRWRPKSRIDLFPIDRKRPEQRFWYSFFSSEYSSWEFKQSHRWVEPVLAFGLEYRHDTYEFEASLPKFSTLPGNVYNSTYTNQLQRLEYWDNDWEWPDGFDYPFRDDTLLKALRSYRGPVNPSAFAQRADTALRYLRSSLAPQQQRLQDRTGRVWRVRFLVV